MKTPHTRPIAVCTWSLQNNLEALVEVLNRTGIRHLHLAVQAIQGETGKTFMKAIRENNWSVSCTMTGFAQEDYSTLETIRQTGGILPDAHWPANRETVLEAIRLTAGLEVPYLSFHAGFIDHGNQQAYSTFCDRMLELADAAATSKVSLLMETGQETAGDLKDCLEALNHPAIGVNFDPANMILYGKGDPIEAVRILAPWIRHVHVKDALPASRPGEWGQEVPWGEGLVDPGRFLASLDETGYRGALAVEREAGDNRVADILKAVEGLAIS